MFKHVCIIHIFQKYSSQSVAQWVASKQKMDAMEVALENASYDIESAGEVCKDVLTNTKGLQKKEKAKGLYQQHEHAKKFQPTGAPTHCVTLVRC